MTYTNPSVQERADELGVRPFAPLKPDHPLAKEPRPCPVCKQDIVVGDVICLLVIESEYNRLEAQRAGPKGFYNAEATPSHWECVTGSPDPEGDFQRWYEER